MPFPPTGGGGAGFIGRNPFAPCGNEGCQNITLDIIYGLKTIAFNFHSTKRFSFSGLKIERSVFETQAGPGQFDRGLRAFPEIQITRQI